MADIHHHHSGTTIVEDDRSGPATILGVLAIAAMIGFLIWLFAFSGLVFNRHNAGSGGASGGTSVTVNNPNNGGAGGAGGNAPQQQPNPASS